MDKDTYTWLEKKYTLVSSNKESITLLLNEVVAWINQLEYSKNEKEKLCNNFKAMIQKKY
jgi:peptidoglycan hydrolase CwlO-like protein